MPVEIPRVLLKDHLHPVEDRQKMTNVEAWLGRLEVNDLHSFGEDQEMRDINLEPEIFQKIHLHPSEDSQNRTSVKVEVGAPQYTLLPGPAEGSNEIDIKKMAKFHCISFATAVALRRSNPSATTIDIAEAICKHYSPTGFTIFSMGAKAEIGIRDEVVPAMAKYIDNWTERGLGFDIRLEKYKVQPFSPSAALCFLTWRQHPPANSNIKSWTWENMYTFRILMGENMDGYWESCLQDNEWLNSQQRFPDFYTPLGTLGFPIEVE